jgi:hypothetical protein
MLFWVEGCPTCETYLEKNDSIMQKVPLHNPTIDVMKAPRLSCSNTLSYKQDGPIYFIYITHYLQQRNLIGIHSGFNSIIKERFRS